MPINTDNTPLSLSHKDERDIARTLENTLDVLNGIVSIGNLEDNKDHETFKASLEIALYLSKKVAEKKFTPKKYRHNYNNEDNKKD